MSGLCIGIDGACWLNRRGYGRYTRSLLAALAQRSDGDRYLLFLDPETAAQPDIPPQMEKAVVATSRPPALAASASGRRGLPDLWRMACAVARQPVHVFFFPSASTYFPLLRPVPTIVTIHDVIAERHPRQVFARRQFEIFWRAKLALAVRQARLILTVSDHACAGIVERFHVRRERVHVVPEAPDPIFRPLPSPRDASEVLPRLPLARGCRFLLYVGGLSPHKNLPVLIDAYRFLIADPEFAELRLLLVGDYTGDVFYSAYPELRRLVARHGLEDRVLFTGYVPDDALVHLYNRAELVVLPSLEEGFGLPAIEAAACGKPVVASEVSPIGSLLGPAAWTFPPHDGTALTRALETLLRDPDKRRAMGAEGCRRAATYTWERTAAQVHALFHEAYGA